MKYLISLLLLAIALSAFSQLAVISGTDTVKYSSKKEYLDKHKSKEGYWICSNINGNIESEGLYTQDKKEGIWKEYYNSGKTKSEITYVAGKADGYAKFYYENGNVSEEGTWRNRAWIGDYKYYFENGNPAYIWKYNETGKRTGVQLYFHENGNKMIEGEWQDGKETGVIKEYYENGALKSEKVFADGKVDVATIKKYEPKEEVLPEVNSLEKFDGNGYYKTINKWRKPEFEGVWKGGKFMDGKKFIYDDNGNYIKTLIYRNGVKVGEKVEE